MKKIHFIGIGGIGVSALAQITLMRGDKVSGSDLKATAMTRKLSSLGAEIFIGHDAKNIGDADMVVYSSAVTSDNPEILKAKEKKIPALLRGEMLAELMSDKSAIAISGTHGKTTTTAMIGLSLERSGLSPTIAVGAHVSHFSGNVRLGFGSHFVAEADESDGSFLYLAPQYSVVTNIEKEHMEHYGEMLKVIDAYAEFIEKTAAAAFLCVDCNNVRNIAKRANRRHISYGRSGDADIRAVDVILDGSRSTYNALYKGKKIGSVELSVPGAHNVVNSLAALGVSLACGVKFDMFAGAMREYTGADRRFQVVHDKNGLTIVDDYGHHPTEVKATIAAARLSKDKRVIVIFQPHRYTRTLNLKEEFAQAFAGADKLILTDVYAACEKPIEGVSTDLICNAVKRSGHKDVCYLPKEKIIKYLLGAVKERDLLLFIGAGDIGELAYELAGCLNGRERAAVSAHDI